MSPAGLTAGVDLVTAPTDAIDPEEVLARWRAGEAALRTRPPAPPGMASHVDPSAQPQ